MDILVNNAGAIPPGTLLAVDSETWRRAWDLKVFGFISLTRALYAGLAARGGVVVNVIGAAGEKFPASYIAGAAGNAALMAFTRALGRASPADNLRVVGINPGATATERFEMLSRHRAEQQMGDAARAPELVRHLPFGRAALPEEIGHAVAFLRQSAVRLHLRHDPDDRRGRGLKAATRAAVDPSCSRQREGAASSAPQQGKHSWNTDSSAARASRCPPSRFGTGTFGGEGEFFKAWGATDVARGQPRSSTSASTPASTCSTRADIYSGGAAEEILGQAIKGRRDQVLISTKATFRFGDGAERRRLVALPPHRRPSKRALKRLGTDYIDLFQLHGFDAHDAGRGDRSRTLDDLVRAGKIRYIGCSNFSGWHLMKSLAVRRHATADRATSRTRPTTRSSAATTSGS